MKRLIVVRHAKSSWDDPELEDHDRPLNGRGKRVAPLMGKHLVDHGVIPDHITSSSAKRALRTAKALQKVYAEFGESPALDKRQELYHASSEEILEVVWSLPSEFRCEMIVGHNPGLEEFLCEVCASNAPARLPTCAVAVLDFEAEGWTQVQPRTAMLRELWIPKELGL